MRETVKRAADLLTLVALAPVAAPLLIGVAGVVRLALGSPVLFRQARTGRGGRKFDLLKFRTMTDERSEDGELLSDERRLTRLGRALRASSLDELPSLLNVLRGEMSFVGPRPFLHDYYPLYSDRQRRRFEVRPGITGWAQVNGRNTIAWEEKFELDIWYVENRSLALDVKILALTARNVLSRHGIAAEGEATMPRFTGSSGEGGGPAPERRD